MAGSFGGGDEDYVSGINVTPLVDVVLVLLVIFLMTAPVLYQSAIKVQLPKAKSAESQEKSPLEFTITRTGETLWNKDKVDLATLGAKVADLVKQNPEQTAIISADEAASHGSVVRLMDTLRQAGLIRFALNVETAQPPTKP